MANQKFTANITAVFEGESYAQAQAWLIEQLMRDEESTHMNIQRLDLIRWSDPMTNRPIDPRTGQAAEEDDE